MAQILESFFILFILSAGGGNASVLLNAILTL